MNKTIKKYKSYILLFFILLIAIIGSLYYNNYIEPMASKKCDMDSLITKLERVNCDGGPINKAINDYNERCDVTLAPNDIISSIESKIQL